MSDGSEALPGADKDATRLHLSEDVVSALLHPARLLLAPTVCRTCLRPITHETRVEDGRFQREGWYDDANVDAIVCFKSADYRHKPMNARERAYYEAGANAILALIPESTRPLPPGGGRA